MRIRYTGPGQGVTVRVVGELVWEPKNGYVCEVSDGLLAANLMTLPGFEVVEDEPLVALVGRDRAFELALAGVASVGDLVALDEDGIVNTQCVCCVTREEVIHWIDVAGGRGAVHEDHLAPRRGIREAYA